MLETTFEDMELQRLTWRLDTWNLEENTAATVSIVEPQVGTCGERSCMYLDGKPKIGPIWKILAFLDYDQKRSTQFFGGPHSPI